MRVAVNATLRPLYSREETRYPFCKQAGGPQSQSGGVRKIDPTVIALPKRPARYESLYRLSYSDPSFVIMKHIQLDPNCLGRVEDAKYFTYQELQEHLHEKLKCQCYCSQYTCNWKSEKQKTQYFVYNRKNISKRCEILHKYCDRTSNV